MKRNALILFGFGIGILFSLVFIDGSVYAIASNTTNATEVNNSSVEIGGPSVNGTGALPCTARWSRCLNGTTSRTCPAGNQTEACTVLSEETEGSQVTQMFKITNTGETHYSTYNKEPKKIDFMSAKNLVLYAVLISMAVGMVFFVIKLFPKKRRNNIQKLSQKINF